MKSMVKVEVIQVTHYRASDNSNHPHRMDAERATFCEEAAKVCGLSRRDHNVDEVLDAIFNERFEIIGLLKAPDEPLEGET